MRVYGLTDLGKRIAKTKTGDTSEYRILQFLRENRTGTDDELDIVGGDRYTLKKMEERNLIKELTT